jgi:hypothetical protein
VLGYGDATLVDVEAVAGTSELPSRPTRHQIREDAVPTPHIHEFAFVLGLGRVRGSIEEGDSALLNKHGLLLFRATMAGSGAAGGPPHSEHHFNKDKSESLSEAGDGVPAAELSTTHRDEEILQETMVQADELAAAKARAEAGGPFRRLSRKLTRPDSLDVESMRVKGMDYAAPVSTIAR